MNERRLRRLLRDRLRHLDLHPPLDPDLLCERFGNHRRRPLKRVPASLPAGAFGALISLRKADLILHQDGLSKPHRDLVILHELVHLILAHVGHESSEEVLCGPDTTGNLYARRIEWEAETGAAILASWTSERSIGKHGAPTDSCELAITRALGGREWT